MQIRVTEKHIKEGIKGSCKSCPIAVAVLETVGDAKAVNVGGSVAFIYDEDWVRQTSPLPLEAETFISEFDQGFKVKPFTFELNI